MLVVYGDIERIFAHCCGCRDENDQIIFSGIVIVNDIILELEIPNPTVPSRG